MSTVAIDEMHRVPLDAPFFRREFGRLRANLLEFMALSQKKVAFVAMTATLTPDLLEEFKAITGTVFDFVQWGDVSRRNIALHLTFAHRTVLPLKKFVNDQRKDGGKDVLYSNHSSRAKKNLLEAVEKVLPVGEDVATVCGDTAKIMKAYYIRGWSASLEEEEPRSLRCLNLTVLVATGAANCGIDSRDCSGVGREGPPPSLIDVAQELGRVRAQAEGNFQYLIVLNVASWASLILRIEKTENQAERKRQLSSLLVVMKLLVLPQGCIHVALETAFSASGQPAAADPEVCGGQCWYCKPALSQGGGGGGGALATKVRSALTRCFSVNGSVSSSGVQDYLRAPRALIWPGVKRVTTQHASRLLLQLIASEILAFTARRPDKKAKHMGSVDLNYNFDNYEDAARWGLFCDSTQLRDA